MKPVGVEGSLCVVQEARNAVLLGFGHLFAVRVEPLAVVLRFFEVELASGEHFAKVHVGIGGLDDDRLFIEFPDDLFALVLLLLGNEVTLVEKDDVGEFDLLRKEMEHRSAVVGIFFPFALEILRGDLPAVEVSLESAAVNYGDARVKLGHAAHIRNVCRGIWDHVFEREGEQLGDLHGLADAGALDDQVVELLLGRELDDLLHDFRSECAANASVRKLDELIFLGHVLRIRDELRVDIHFGHVVDDDGTPQLAAIFEDVLEKRGLPGS